MPKVTNEEIRTAVETIMNLDADEARQCIAEMIHWVPDPVVKIWAVSLACYLQTHENDDQS